MVPVRILPLFTSFLMFDISSAAGQSSLGLKQQGLPTDNTTVAGKGPSTISLDRGSEASEFLRVVNSSTVSVHQLEHSPPRKARNALHKGLRLLLKARFVEAIPWLCEAVKIDPEYTDAQNDLAAAYLKLGMPDKAIPPLISAIKSDPHWELPYFNLVLVYIHKNEFSKAEDTARQLIGIAPGNQRARIVLGLALTLENRFTPETQAVLTDAESVFPEATLLIGRVLAGRGEIEAAKSKISAYLASPGSRGRDIASEWLELLDRAR